MAVVGLGATVVILLLVWPTVQVALGGDQYVFLARQLAEGRLDVDNLPPRYGDYAPWQGHKYLPFGPLPALLLVPLLPLLNAGMALVFVGYAFTAANVLILYRLLGLAGVSDERRHWAALLYFAGTPYLGVTLIGISTYYAHIVATTFLLLAIHEALGKQRWLLVGVTLGLAAACRFTEIFALPFFLWMAAAGDGGVGAGEQPQRARFETRPATLLPRLAMLFSGLAAPILLLCAYNYARFGNIAETGFGTAVLYSDVLYEARSAGLFSLEHVPKNFFMMLLQGPQPVGGDSTAVLRFPYVEPSQWGMGLFFTSPALLYVFRARFSENLVRACWIATFTLLVPILAYYGIGYLQFGYRYALDFMPFLIVLAARGLPHPMTNRARALVTASVLINFWGALMLAVWM
ncbi:MAG TPA: hypothetical protein VES88_08820 [Gemmatimonadaceae bacterium]|nr:hypothetical protein [Gemmatimonadaceae bacterium]